MKGGVARTPRNAATICARLYPYTLDRTQPASASTTGPTSAASPEPRIFLSRAITALCRATSSPTSTRTRTFVSSASTMLSLHVRPHALVHLLERGCARRPREDARQIFQTAPG